VSFIQGNIPIHINCASTPICGNTTTPRNRSLNKDGTMKEVQNTLETFNTRLIRANIIHMVIEMLFNNKIQIFFFWNEFLILKIIQLHTFLKETCE